MHRARFYQKGQALVEVALVLPLMILILLTLVTLWRIAHFRLTLVGAARYGATVDAGGGDGVRAVKDYLSANLPPGDGRVISVRLDKGYPLTKVEIVGRVAVAEPWSGTVEVQVESGMGRSLLFVK